VITSDAERAFVDKRPAVSQAVGMTAAEPSEMLSGHIIVCGLHSVGLRVVEQLHAACVQSSDLRNLETALEYPPRRDTRFESGDRAYLIGPYEELLRVLRRDQGA